MNTFRTLILIGFAVFGAIGIGIFAMGGLGGGSGENIGKVELWGTIDKKIISECLKEMGNKELEESITYVQKEKDTYDEDLVEALASDQAPDLFFLTQDKILKFKNKIFQISYENFEKRKFKDEFIREGEMYLGADGIYGLPLAVDPLIMYWNRDIFSVEGISEPPQFWDELFALSEKLTIKDDSSNIERSAVALGEYSNIKHAKEILSAIVFQAGGDVVVLENGIPESVFNEKPESEKTKPSVSALRFFTEFSNPSKKSYSWNTSFNEAKEEFTAGNLGVYFGFASEIYSISRTNPNLDFDLAQLPKKDSSSGETFGKMKAISITRGTDNYGGAVIVSKILSSKKFVNILSSKLGISPSRRDLISETPDEEYLSVFYRSALNARGWYDPNVQKTEEIFEDMINYITSGRLNISEAVSMADRELGVLLDDIKN